MDREKKSNKKYIAMITTAITGVNSKVLRGMHGFII